MTGIQRWKKQLYGLQELEGEFTQRLVPVLSTEKLSPPMVFGRRWYSLAGELVALFFPCP